MIKEKAFWISLVLLSPVVIGCATTQPSLYSSDVAQKMVMRPSDYHQFTFTRVYEEDGELIVYGKVRHNHKFCEREGHVDLASVEKTGQVVFATSIPLRSQSRKLHGWYGAGFGARFASKNGGEELRLTFHDQECHNGWSYSCGDNQAERN